MDKATSILTTTENQGLVFEANANAKESTVFGAGKARQAALHPNWLEDRSELKGVKFDVVIITPCKSAGSGAMAHLGETRLWDLGDFRTWVRDAIAVLRQLKAEFPGESDLAWQSTALETLKKHSMTIQKLREVLPKARDAFQSAH